MPKKQHLAKLSKKNLLWLVLLVVGLYVLLPQFKDFHASWHLLAHPKMGYVWAGLGLTIFTYFAAGITYCFLSVKKLPVMEESFVQVAAMFVNRLLPAGIGGLGANYQYLKHKKIKGETAASIVALNNLLGALGHVLLVLLALALAGHSQIIPKSNLSSGLKTSLEIGGAVIIIGILGVLFFGQAKLLRAIGRFLGQIAAFRNRPGSVILALLSQMALSLANFLCLYYSALAVGVHLPYVAIVLIFTLGVGTRNISPTPGGLGGFEAGLVAGMIAYHVPGAEALAAVLLFRIVNYWIPLVFGAAAFFVAEKRELFA